MQQKSKPPNKSIKVCSPSSVFHLHSPKRVSQSYHKKNQFKVSEYYHKPRSYVPSLIMYVKKLVHISRQLSVYSEQNTGYTIKGSKFNPPIRARQFSSASRLALPPPPRPGPISSPESTRCFYPRNKKARLPRHLISTPPYARMARCSVKHSDFTFHLQTESQNKRLPTTPCNKKTFKNGCQTNRQYSRQTTNLMQIMLYNMFIIIILYMFRATLCSSSGGQILLIQHLVQYTIQVSSNSVLVIRRSNCINTASGIVYHTCFEQLCAHYQEVPTPHKQSMYLWYNCLISISCTT